MRIKVISKERRLNLVLPTRLIFSPMLVHFGLRIARKYAPKETEHLPPEGVAALCDEICKIKKQYGRYELVDIQSADGELVKIIL